MFRIGVALTVLCLPVVADVGSPFIRGDANGDGTVLIDDVISSLGHLFQYQPTVCRDALDADDNGTVDIADPIYVLTYLFSSGAAFPAPYPDCGFDPTFDALACEGPVAPCPPPSASGPAFTNSRYPVGADPRGCGAGDFDGDGVLDFAVCSTDDNEILVFINRQDGSFDPGVAYPTPNAQERLLVHDVNSDGTPDVVITITSGVAVLLGNGDGTLGAAISSFIGNQESLAIGDIDADSIPDLIFADESDDTVRVSFGSGTGTFGATWSYPVGLGPRHAAVGDVDQDGNLDIIATNTAGQSLSVLMGTSSTAFDPAVDYDLGAFPQSVAIGDFTNDGWSDAIVLTWNAMIALVGTGGGDLSVVGTTFVGEVPVAARLADVDLDGFVDVVVSLQGDHEVYVGFGSGSGTFPTSSRVPVGELPGEMCLADFDLDGVHDLAVLNRGSRDVSVLRGDGVAFRSNLRYDAPFGPLDIATADFDGDGWLDAVVGRNTDVIVYRGGPGGFTSATVPSGGSSHVVRTGDMNEDGFPDIVAINWLSASIAILVSNGDGTFQLPQIQSIVNYASDLDLGDVNNDGHLDMVLCLEGDDETAVVLGSGGGPLTALPFLSAGPSPTSVLLRDLDGDALLDLVVANSDGVRVRLGNGDGTFGSQQSFGAGGIGPRHVQAIDLEGDGDLDLLVANEFSDNVGRLLNSGSGVFVAVLGYPAGDRPMGLAVADYNCDGFADVVTVDGNSGTISWMPGDGSPTLGAPQPFGAGVVPLHITSGDVDGDGDLDVLVTDHTEDTLIVILNLFLL